MSEEPQTSQGSRTVTAVTNRNWSTPDNIVCLSPLPTYAPTTTDTPCSGGTVGILDGFRSPIHRINTDPKNGPALTPDELQLNSHPLNQPSFDSKIMMLFLDGGKTKSQRRKFIQGPTKQMDFLHKYSLSRPDSLTEHLKLFTMIHDKYVTRMVPSREDIAAMTSIAAHTGTFANHFGLGVNTILNASSDDQRDEWLPPALQSQIIVAYAQTELKHGSNVRGLQTTAEYSHDHKAFIINSNTLGGQKWWPGGLGATSTHAIVYANLIIKGKDYGVHSFFVQVRDKNHRPLPGITIGANGDCLGDYGNDTGFLGLKDVVIPKFNMFAKFQWVDDDGNYIKSPEKIQNPRLHYLTMMQTRAGMVMKQSGLLARGITIAVRYSYVRTQGFMNQNIATALNTISLERQLVTRTHDNVKNNNDGDDGNKYAANVRRLKNLQNFIQPANGLGPSNEQQSQSKSDIESTTKDGKSRTSQQSQIRPRTAAAAAAAAAAAQQIRPQTVSSRPELTPQDLLSLVPSSSTNPNHQLRLPMTSIPHLWRKTPIQLFDPENSNDKKNDKLFSFQQDEYPIIEYAPQRTRIFKQLALTYILKSTGKYMGDLFNQFTGGESMGAGDLDLDILGDLAPITAGLKAMTTSLTHQGLVDLRESLGGNGYLKASGIGQLYLDYMWELNAEGDRVPMLLQCGRFILKQLNHVIETWLIHKYGHASGRETHTKKFVPISPSNDYLKSFGSALINGIALGSSKASTEECKIQPLPNIVSIYNFCFSDFLSNSVAFGQDGESTHPNTVHSTNHPNQQQGKGRDSEPVTPHNTPNSSYSSSPHDSKKSSSDNFPKSSNFHHSQIKSNKFTQNPLPFNQNSPYFLLYLLRLSQFKSLSLWVQLLNQYCTQLEYLTDCLNAAPESQKSQCPYLQQQKQQLLQQQQQQKQNDFFSSPQSIQPSISSSPPVTNPHSSLESHHTQIITPLELHSSTFTTSHQEIILNSISQLLLLATEQHCRTFMFTCFISQIIALHAINSNAPINKDVALTLMNNDSTKGGISNPFYSNLQSQLQELMKTSEKEFLIKQVKKDELVLPSTPAQSSQSQPLSTPDHKHQLEQHQNQIINTFTQQYSTLIPVLTQLATFWLSNELIQDTPVQPALFHHQNTSHHHITPLLAPPFPSQSFLSYPHLTLLQITSGHNIIPEAISLVDAFDISDSVLASVVGNGDGNMYESLVYNALQHSENNISSPWSPQGYNDVFANRVDVDMLDRGKMEQDELYNLIFAHGGRNLEQPLWPSSTTNTSRDSVGREIGKLGSGQQRQAKL